MEDLITVKRGSALHVLRFDKRGRFSLNRYAAKTMGIGDNDGVMFKFNQKERKAYICKDNEPDAFIIERQKNYHIYRWASIDLYNHFARVFVIDDTQSEFAVSRTPDSRGYHELTMVIK